MEIPAENPTFEDMYTAHVNDRVFTIEVFDAEFRVNGTRISWDVSANGDGFFHVLLNDKGYRAEIVEVDSAGRRLVVKVNGRRYPVVLKDKFDVLLEKMGMNANAAAKVNHVRAPMPGLIIQLKVKDDDTVKAGDTLLILEAMKMENIIKAPGDAVVRSVKVAMGDGVEKNQILIEF